MSRGGWGAVGWLRSSTRPPPHCGPSSLTTSSRVRPGSLTVAGVPNGDERDLRPRASRRARYSRTVVLPGVHRVASLSKRCLIGTHQGAIEADHLGEYLNEFVFRFNRRRFAQSRAGLLPRPRARRRPRPGPLSGSGSQPHTQCKATSTASGTETSPEHGPSPGRQTMESGMTRGSPVRWITRTCLYREGRRGIVADLRGSQGHRQEGRRKGAGQKGANRTFAM